MAYVPGDYLVMCDRCGFTRYASECKMTWDKWLVCFPECWEEKHPALEPHKLPSDKTTPKDIRPEKYYFIEPPEEA